MPVDQTIAITGGAGFIGTHLALRLAEDNRLKLIDIKVEENSIGYTELLSHANVSVAAGDVCNLEFVRNELAGCDIVIHMASLLGVRNVINNARRTMDTIVLGTRNVLEACREHNSVKLVVNLSTSEIYGNTCSLSETAPASICADNDPRMSYAAAKLLAEHMAWSYARDVGMRVINICPFNVFGPLQLTPNAIGTFIVRAIAGSDLLVYGSGSQLRSWCFIDDFCDGLLACLDRTSAVGQHINLGNPLTTCTVYDIAQRIVELTKGNSQIRLTPQPFSDIEVRTLNGEKAARLLDFHPRVGIAEGLRKTIAWYREHHSDFQAWL